MSKVQCYTGGCLCESIKYEVHGPLRPVVACHCTQCQKTSGHFVAATNAAFKDLVFQKAESLQWYQSSTTAKRAFCSTCGSNLFWQQTNSQTISIFAGSLDKPTNLQLVEHIFVADKSDYYQLTDGLPQHPSFESDLCNI